MNKLYINKHGSDYCTVIREEWQDFPWGFLLSVFLFFIEKSSCLIVTASRPYGYDPKEAVLGQLELSRKYSTYWEVSKILEVKVIYKIENASSDDLAEVLAVVWFAFENLTFYFLLEEKGNQLRDLVKYPNPAVFLNLHHGYCIRHSGEEENMLIVQKSQQLNMESFYKTVLKEK